MRQTIIMGLALCASVIPAVAMAQTGDDVVVMRRAVSTPVPRISWSTGEWQRTSTCGEEIPVTRTVQCLKQTPGLPSEVRPDSECGGDKPAASSVESDLSGCQSSWRTTEWSSWSTMCGAGATRTRNAYCARTDGKVMPDAECGGNRPTETETADRFEGCTFSWGVEQQGAWSSTCSTDAVRSRAIYCARSDGTRAPAESCDAATRPEDVERAQVTTGCTAVWEANPWGSWSSSCGAATRTRTVSCRVKDPATGIMLPGTVESERCEGQQAPTTTESGYGSETCPYRWIKEGEYFGAANGASMCSGGKLSTGVTYGCYYYHNGQKNSRASESDCTRYVPKPSALQEYSCYFNNTGVTTAEMSPWNGNYGARPVIKTFSGILSTTAAQAEAREMCRPINPYHTKDESTCRIVIQRNSARNETRVAVGVDSYGIPDAVTLSTSDNGWTSPEIWGIRFTQYGGIPIGVVVNAKPDPTGVTGPSNCGVIAGVQPYGTVPTVFNCTGG